MLELRPATREFFHMLHNYLHCRELLDAKYEEIDSLRILSHLEIQSEGIETESGDPWEFKASYQQQAVDGNQVNTCEELYVAAGIAKPIYEAKVQDIVARVCGQEDQEESVVVVQFPPVKGRERALEKADDDYIRRKPATAVSWLYDVVRGSIQFSTIEQIEQFIQQIQEDSSITIVKAKNRFKRPSLTGYRDFNLHIHIETDRGFKHVCELQIHLQDMKALENTLESHKYYEYFRSYFAGATDSLKERLDDLKAISDGSDVNEEFLSRFLEKTKDVSRLQRLARLFYNTLCEYDWAYQVYEHVLELQFGSLGDCHVEVAQTYNCMGEILRDDGKSELAIELHQKALDICTESALEAGSQVWADTYNQMANALYYRDRLDEALELYGKALKVFAMDEAGNQIPMSVTTNNMANIVLEQGNREKALELYESALHIQKRVRGMEHPSVAETYANIAKVLFYKNKLEEALDLQLKVLDIRKKTLGEKHRTVKDAYNKLAQTYSSLSIRLESKRQYDQALATLEQELAIRQQMATENDSSHLDETLDLKIADVYQNMSLVMEKQGKLKESLQVLEKCLDIRRDFLNEQHHTVKKATKQKESLQQKIENQ
ncbi:unnamed protein product [Cylindrotheca closterium]|uniref:Uncharacterized protein n=1 Tax=Cylindrotheca closterium TaxID=2856 RepID=A0AAD2JP55_9STRA|nr:unnamed protein product [Cylindrotheca closterium]